MIFNELYSIYYDIAARVLQELTRFNGISESKLMRIISASADIEDVAFIREKLVGGAWNLIDKSGQTPVRHEPIQPLTLIERRWLKTLLNDPRIRLFDVSACGLEDVEPLWTADDFRIYDALGTPDPWDDENYIRHFKCILRAIKTGEDLKVEWTSRENYVCSAVCHPENLEYTLLEDKFRLHASAGTKAITINISRIIQCQICQTNTYSITFPRDIDVCLPDATERACTRQISEQTGYNNNYGIVSFVIQDIDNAYERVLLDFSIFQKRDIQKLDNKRYKFVLCYEPSDFQELIIRLLSYGPKIQVLSPESVISRIRDHIKRQAMLFRQPGVHTGESALLSNSSK